MNPLSGSLKFLSSTLFNSAIAFLFFLLATRFVSPAFVGKVAIVQLLETITLVIFGILPNSLIMREISEKLGKSEKYNELVSTPLTYSILVSPFMLLLFILPPYLWLAIPYLILNLYSTYQGGILAGLGKFTEASIGNIVFSLIRWGVSIIAIIYRSFTLFVLIWIVAAVIRTTYFHLFIPFKFSLDVKIAKEIVKIGFPIYLSGIVLFLSSQGDRVITAYLLGSYYLGIYQLIALASTVPSMFINSFSSALLPSSTYYSAKGADLKEIASTSFRVLVLISLPIAILGYTLTPLFIRLFPGYSSGALSMQILILFLTATMPLQMLSTFLIAAKKNYRPFLLIGIASAVEVIVVSYFLIPRLSILGAAIAQAGNVILVSALYLYYAINQGIFELDKHNLSTIILIGVAFISLISWIPALLLIILGIKFLGVIRKEDVLVIEKFTPKKLKGPVKLFYFFSTR